MQTLEVRVHPGVGPDHIVQETPDLQKALTRKAPLSGAFDQISEFLDQGVGLGPLSYRH
jgi:hypothetical protein